MATVHHPALPAVPDYPTKSSHANELDEARRLFVEELASPDADWEEQGEREGVQLWSKADPNVRPLPPISPRTAREVPALTPHSLAQDPCALSRRPRSPLLVCS